MTSFAKNDKKVRLSAAFFLTYFTKRLITTLGVIFSMNSPKEPEPGPDRRAQRCGSGREAGRILRIDLPKREGYVRGVVRGEFIGG